MQRADPNTDDYSQFVGRIAFETREAMAPHLAEEHVIARALRKMGLDTKSTMSTELAEQLSYYWGARNHTARLLRAPTQRPAFVHCHECRLPVAPSGWKFAFTPMAVTPEKMAEACQSAQRWHAEGSA